MQARIFSIHSLVSILFSFILCFSTQAKSADNSVEIFGRMPFVKNVQISPDGQFMAYFQERDGRYLLVARRLDGKGKPKVLDIPERNLTSFTWVGKDRIFVQMFTTKYIKTEKEKHTFWRAGIYNVEENDMIWPFSGTTFNFNLGSPQLVNKLKDDSEHILVEYYFDEKNALIKLNVQDGSWDVLEAGSYQDGWLADGKGNVKLVFTRMKGEEELVAHYRANEEADYQPLWVVEDGERVPLTNGGIDFDDSGKYLYIKSRDEDEKRVIMRAEIDETNTLTNLKTVFNLEKYDVGGFAYSYSSLLVNGAAFTKDYSDFHYFDKVLVQVQADLKATFPNASITITSYDQKKERWIVEVSGADYGIEYYFYDQKQASIALLASAYPNYSPKAGGLVKRFDYVTSDEVPLEAYLTLPRQKSKKKPPLIVMPHGGPASRDDMSFYWQRQFFATHGYAVFQPNFRGSTGFGYKFTKSGYEQWGKRMQLDVNDGVQELIKQGIVDKDNICIVGGSYGGYTA